MSDISLRRRLLSANNPEAGASIIEIVIVLAAMVILTAMSIPYLANYKKLYKSEDQAIKVMDLMREASQMALTRRRTMRLEIDLTDNALLIIDQTPNAAGTLVKKIPLELARDVRMDVAPSSITKPNPPNYADAAFATDATGHLVGASTVTGHNVWAARFKSDGTVVNASDVPLSATIYVWPPVSSGSGTARNTGEVRAITMFGGSGAIRYWKYSGSAWAASQ